MEKAIAVPLIASTRMYNQSPRIRAHWDLILARIAALSGVELEIIAHAAPAPLNDLWTRADLGCAFMCGFPYAKLPSATRPVPLAAPISRAPWAGGRPHYASHIVVRAHGPVESAADLASARWGWTARDSQSGYHAPRDFLARTFGRLPPHPDPVGGLLNPVGILAALRDDRITAGAVDAFAWQLLERLEPETLAGLRILATTEPRPMPMLVAARGTDAAMIWRLQSALLQLGQDGEGRSLLDAIDVEAFAPVDPCDYTELQRLAEAADAILEAAW